MSRDGEYICLWWETDHDPPEFVRGHVDFETAIASVSREVGVPVEKLRGEYPYLAHIYARWELPSMHALSNGLDKVLKEYPEPARGCFKVTRLTPSGTGQRKEPVAIDAAKEPPC